MIELGREEAGRPAVTDTPTQPTLAQIVAALSVTYDDGGVLMWLYVKRKSDGRSAIDMIEHGQIGQVANMVRALGDCDPSNFTITEVRG